MRIAPLSTADYTPEDRFFSTPFVDVDEHRTAPEEHRYVHGGFASTDTRFAFCFPPADRYAGRFLQHLEGGVGGDELSNQAAMVPMAGGMSLAFDLGAYMVESNQGHIGNTLCPKAGDDGSIYSYRASAETARLGRWLAGQLYGSAPQYGYVYGASGGAKRALACIERTTGVWDGAVPFVVAGDFPSGYSSMANARRVLGSALARLVDAMSPGGSGDPFDGFTLEQREAIADLYRSGFPVGAEPGIAVPLGENVLWPLEADRMRARDEEFFERFWTEPGHAGAGDPRLTGSLVSLTTTVKAVVTGAELMAHVTEVDLVSALAMSRADVAVGIVVEHALTAPPLGSRIRVRSGAAVGRSVFCAGTNGDVILASSFGEGGEAAFAGVASGDVVELDNRDYLAWCHYPRHHIAQGYDEFAHLTWHGTPIHPQRPQHRAHHPFYGEAVTGEPNGRVIAIANTHDTAAWPGHAVYYDRLLRRRLGPRADDVFRLWWTEHGEHLPPIFFPDRRPPVPDTRLVPFLGCVEQALSDVIAWAERGTPPPASTQYVYEGGRLTLPSSAAERRGVQPVVTARVSVEGRNAADVGEAVSIDVTAVVPPGGGGIHVIELDPDGTGAWPYREQLAGDAEATCSFSHAYAEAGTYLAAARVTSSRSAQLGSRGAIINLARVRVVVGGAPA